MKMNIHYILYYSSMYSIYQISYETYLSINNTFTLHQLNQVLVY